MPAPSEAALLAWVNAHLPATCPQALNYSSSFSTGQILARLTEALSGQTKRELADDSRFEELTGGDPFDHVDVVLDLFDFLLDLKVNTGDVSVAEVLQGKETQIIKLIENIKLRFSAPSLASSLA